MRHKYMGTMKDGNGRVIGSKTTSDGVAGTCSVYLANGSTAASVYEAETGGSAVNSVTSGEYGHFSFWVDPKDYSVTQRFKIVLSHSDFESQTYDDLTIILYPDVEARYIVDADEADQGAAGDGYSLKDLVDAIGTSEQATIFFTHSSTGNTTTYTLTTSETVPSNINLKFENGAILDGAGTLTINGPFEAGSYQVFGSSITVTFGVGSVKELYIEWWGGAGDDSTDNATAIQAAVDSIDGTGTGVKGGTLQFFAGKYKIGSQITAEGSICMRGVNVNATEIISTQTNANSLFLFKKSSNAVHDVNIEDIHFTGNTSNHTGGCFYFDSPYRVSINRVQIYSFGGIGIEAEQGETSTCQTFSMRDSRIYYNYKGGLKYGDPTGDTMGYLLNLYGNQFIQNSYFGVYLYKSQSCNIIGNEFAGYYYGNTPAGATHQAVPIAIDGGNCIFIANNSFETNGGKSGTAGYNIRTGYDGEAQSEQTDNTRHLTIQNNDFKGVGAADRDLNHIKLHWVIDVVVQNNHFEHNNSHAGTYYGIEWGTLSAYYSFVFIANEWNSTLDDRFTGTAPAYTWIDQNQIYNTAIWNFDANDATPSVKASHTKSSANIFKTVNTVATTLSDLDDMIKGQRATILIGDANTTIDFTGTNLYGNVGVDWSPASGDYMECWCFDGTKKYCIVVDTTS